MGQLQVICLNNGKCVQVAKAPLGHSVFQEMQYLSAASQPSCFLSCRGKREKVDVLIWEWEAEW